MHIQILNILVWVYYNYISTIQFAIFQASRSLNSSPFYSRERIKTLFLSIFGGCNSLLASFCIFFRGSDPLTDLADILFLCFALFMSPCNSSIFACSPSITNLRSSGFLTSFKEGERDWCLNPSSTILCTCFLPAELKCEKREFKDWETEIMIYANICPD